MNQPNSASSASRDAEWMRQTLPLSAVNLTNTETVPVLLASIAQPIEPAAAPAKAPSLGKTLLHIAWLAILLGLIVQAALLITAIVLDKAIEGKSLLADLSQKISWSVVVCLGLAIGKAATKLQAVATAAASTVARLSIAGLAGLLSAPLAFTFARAVHKGAQEALAIKSAQPGPAGATIWLTALIKALEYAALGAVLVWIGNKLWGRALAHAGVGLLIGAIFGTALIWLTTPSGNSAALSFGALLPRAINEIIHPMGCALALYVAEVLGRAGASK